MTASIASHPHNKGILFAFFLACLSVKSPFYFFVMSEVSACQKDKLVIENCSCVTPENKEWDTKVTNTEFENNTNRTLCIHLGVQTRDISHLMSQVMSRLSHVRRLQFYSDQPIRSFENEYDKDSVVHESSSTMVEPSAPYIGPGFLRKCTMLQHVDLNAFRDIIYIDRFFLSSCCSLTCVDLSPLNNVTTIGNNFLSLCSGLKYVDLSTLNNVITIGKYFLEGCSSLEFVDLGFLTMNTAIPKDFCSAYKGLIRVKTAAISARLCGINPELSQRIIVRHDVSSCNIPAKEFARLVKYWMPEQVNQSPLSRFDALRCRLLRVVNNNRSS